MGEAFQLRDDIIGVFGDPEKTGKPAGDDLREGKRTVLVATTLSRASSSEREKFLELFGRKELDIAHIDALRQIITETGALAELESIIATMTSKAHDALSHGGITPEAKALLDQMAIAATQRSS